MKIKIVFEIGLIGDLHHSQAGLYRVADELLKRFTKNPDMDLRYSLYAHSSSKTSTPDIEAILKEKGSILKGVNTRKRIAFLPFRKEKLFKFIYKQFGITNYKIVDNCELKDAQIYHSPYFPIPEKLQKHTELKKVVTVHDLIPFLFPHLNSDKNLMEEIFESIGSDGFVICVSESTKKDLLKLVPFINPAHVYVSLLAASAEKFFVCEDEANLKKLQLKYNLPERYFLGLSTLEPRKNIDHVIKSFVQTITENNIDDLSLVLVGSNGWDYDNIFKAYENCEKLKCKIIFTGRIPDDELATVYSNAEAFFYMSFYEGFGLPVLEAMQCGVPVVVSDNSSLPEVVGDSGILLDAKDEFGLRKTMLDLYQNEALRRELSEKSLKRAKQFSWEKTVNTHLTIYKHILNSET
ncbi:glycosyltransferase family 4 protein [Chryseobacterium sp. MP_3.2]|uniref:glycosyltransferase family 4 protein n=1 Tax=Chryseobacterium sp. MP_3.2 TaxID=3071712 RepID=UPI002DFE4034|nr:glycosyltransferase involved in cell wall biosynthesis [Chryseobacterium sp. MP_3.2]